MKVFIVRTLIYYEGSNIEGVFETFEDAKKYADAIKLDKWGDETIIDEYILNSSQVIKSTII